MNNLNIDQTIAHIHSIDDEQELLKLSQAIEFRRKALAQQKMWDFKIGQEVVFNQKTRPQYLIGRRVVIEQINRSRVVVRLVDKVDGGRFQGRITTSPDLLSVKIGF